jgi:V8-like Glu-specific endopeptidase
MDWDRAIELARRDVVPRGAPLVEMDSWVSVASSPPAFGLVESAADGTTKSILGTDGRTKVGNMFDSRYSSVGLVLAIYDQGAALGTGTLIGRNHVLTAAHLVYQWPDAGRTPPKRPTMVFFIPAVSGDRHYIDWGQLDSLPLMGATRPFGIARAAETLVNPDYVRAESFGEDFAVLRLDRNVGDYAGWMDVLPPQTDAALRGSTVTNIGYPSDLNEELRLNAYEQIGTIQQLDSNLLASANLDGASGQSGSPLFRYRDNLRPGIVGVFVATGPQYNGGMRIDNDAFQKISQWLTADGRAADRADLVSHDWWFDYRLNHLRNIVNDDGETVTGVFYVRNTGTRASGPFWVEFVYSDFAPFEGLKQKTDRVRVESIQPFETRAVEFQRKLLPASVPVNQATYDVFTRIDTLNEVVEFNESGNLGFFYDSIESPNFVAGRSTRTSAPDEYFLPLVANSSVNSAMGLRANDTEKYEVSIVWMDGQRFRQTFTPIVAMNGGFQVINDSLIPGVRQGSYGSFVPYQHANTFLVHVGDPHMYDVKRSSANLPFRLGSFNKGRWEFEADGDLTSSLADEVFSFGVPTDVPMVGDWNGDGIDEVGVVRGSSWFLDSNGTPGWQGNDTSLLFGGGGDLPVAGDWNGDGKDDPGVFRNGTWFLDSNGTRGWQGNDSSVSFGVATDRLVVGDWDGDGKDDIGVVRGDLWYLDTNKTRGWQGDDTVVRFGSVGDVPVVGDWNRDGRDDLGVYRNGTWFLDSNGSLGWQGNDRTIVYSVGNQTPLVAMGRSRAPLLQGLDAGSAAGTWGGRLQWNEGKPAPWTGIFDASATVNARGNGWFDASILLTNLSGARLRLQTDPFSTGDSSNRAVAVSVVESSATTGQSSLPKGMMVRLEAGVLNLNFIDGSKARLSRLG